MQLQVSAVVQSFYVVKCCYFMISAEQIRSGYKDHCQEDFWRKIPEEAFKERYKFDPDLVKYYGLIVYMLIPFWYEMRTLLDWLGTPTTLRMDQWFNVEDIAITLFKNKCNRAFERQVFETQRARGERQTLLQKTGGVFMFIGLVALLIFPLLLFSSGSPAVTPNKLTGSSLSIALNVRQEDQTDTTYTLYQSARGYLHTIDKNTLSAATAQGLQNLDLQYTTQVLSWPQNSLLNFAYTIPLQESLTAGFLTHSGNSSEVHLSFTYTVSREGPADNKDMQYPPPGYAPTNPLSQSDKNAFRNTIESVMGQQCTTNITKQVAATMAKAHTIRVNSSNAVSAIRFPRTGEAVNDVTSTDVTTTDGHTESAVTLEFELYRQWNVLTAACEAWWSVRLCNNGHPQCDEDTGDIGVYVGTASQKQLSDIFAYLQGLGLTGVYISVVLVIGRAMRPTFSNLQALIPYMEMQDTSRPYQLIRDIYLARADGELMVEELSYEELIDMYRDPHVLCTSTTKEGHKHKQD